MRLINTATGKLEEFPSHKTPPYAILSHRWGDGEISYQDLQAERKPGKEAGYEKLDHVSKLAAAAGYNYVWMDTCCIDKANHAELSEAINSMFSWYQEAQICYAYLVDVPATGSNLIGSSASSIRNSQWFTRGWTLQELLAPPEIVFLASDWTELGRKAELAPIVADITRIPVEYLTGRSLQQASIAQRMSWVAKRETTKEEDIAYCMLGIFDIYMPLLYGERQAGAFRRLQEEILKRSTDQSIFAWRNDDLSTVESSFCLLASAPKFFVSSHNIVLGDLPIISGHLEGRRSPTIIDNKGLHLALPLIRENKRVLAILGCTEAGEDHHRLAIELLDVSTNGGRFVRVEWNFLEMVPMETILSKAEYQQLSCEMTFPQTDPIPHSMSGRAKLEKVFRLRSSPYATLPENYPRPETRSSQFLDWFGCCRFKRKAVKQNPALVSYVNM